MFRQQVLQRKFNLNLGVDEEKRLTSSDRLTFKSMNPEIATVDSAGNVRPAHKGNYGSTVILVEYNYNDLEVVNKFKGNDSCKGCTLYGCSVTNGSSRRRIYNRIKIRWNRLGMGL